MLILSQDKKFHCHTCIHSTARCNRMALEINTEWNMYNKKNNSVAVEDKTLADVAGEKTANDVFQILTKNGVNEEYATKIKPWAAMFSIAA